MPLRRDQRRARALALDDRVGGERGAVDDDGDVLGTQARARQDCGHALLDALLRRRGRGENLGGGEPPRVLERHVGEGAADVDGYAGTLHQVLALLSYVRTSPTTRTRTRSEFPGR